MTRKVIFTPDDYWTNPPPKENTVTNQDAYIDLNQHITLNLEDDGLKVGLVPHDGGIAILLTLTTDLGKFVVALSPHHLQVLYAVLQNIGTFTPEQYQTAYNQILALHQKGTTE